MRCKLNLLKSVHKNCPDNKKIRTIFPMTSLEKGDADNHFTSFVNLVKKINLDLKNLSFAQNWNMIS
jgi:hypothetical protein